ncbi:cystathionine beta-synthase [Lujinxingia litoralis]|uniref:Cystathionine beta-synthase n=1 Tax=Lujinxingia litoralis TaxID=2211119 RepID=A0A328C5D0_9DELT|nr:cystathionine beta-synthase [Lujinxingia litoralis]RAL22439.1 cystathionine beta-synthase [Lujinxingia litoralis]
MKAANHILEVIGNTPLVKSHTIARHVKPDIFLKLEYLNPGSSVKDRPALQIIEDAEAAGELRPGGTIVEATSGNTGMGLAMAAAIKGYKCIFVMPDKMSEEKIKTLRAFGARVVVCPTAVEPDDPRSYYSVAIRLAQETPGAFHANQYHNPSNPRAHYLKTGPEIWEQTEGNIDVFVATMGTGGTISGTAKYLKEQNPDIKVVGVDPIGSIYYDYFKTGKMTEAHSYLVEGFGEDIIPSTMDFDWLDDVVRVTDKECFITTRRLVREEGVFAGGSSGGCLAGAVKYAERMDRHANIVTIMCDTAGRYLTKIFDDEWMRENGFLDDDTGVGTVADMLGGSEQTVYTTEKGASVAEVVGLMKTHGISQLPVVDGERIAGIVSESDVLNHLLSDGGKGDDPIDALVKTDFAVVEPTNRVSLIGQFFRQNKVVLVLDGKKLVGIITKIDFIDYVSRQI